MQQWPRLAVALLASTLVVGVAIWRLVHAISGGSRTTQTISLGSGRTPLAQTL